MSARRIYFPVLITLVGLCSFVQAKIEPWSVDAAHSSARFEVSHLVISTVDGKFGEVGGEVNFDPEAFTAGKEVDKMKFDLWAKTASIDTGEKKRDEHLKSEDFFDAKKKGNDKITFVSTKITKTTGEAFTATGNLTMNGTTKPVTFDGKFKGTAVAHDKKRMGISLGADIKRKDWGITWNDVVEAGPVIGDTVKVTLNIEAQQAASAKKAPAKKT